MNVGHFYRLAGNVTQLDKLPITSPPDLEKYIGFGPGRLAAGYWVMLFKGILKADDFEMDGTTLRSGGKDGLPLKDPVADEARKRVHDRLLADRGKAGYSAFRQLHLRLIPPIGAQRLIKIRANTPHSDDIAPDIQYPPGGGGLQWRLIRRMRFLAALHIDADGMATSRQFQLSVGNIPYLKLMENRTAIRRFLETA